MLLGKVIRIQFSMLQISLCNYKSSDICTVYKFIVKNQESSPKYPENVGQKIDKMPNVTVANQ
jgi:hypothetical protein